MALRALIAALLLALIPAGAHAADDLKKIVVALKPDKDPDQMLEERERLKAALADKLGAPVDVIIPLSGSVILEGLANGSIDIAYLSATDMIHSRKKDAAELLLAGEIEGRTSYDSYWVALKEKPYEKVADLRGKPVAFSSRTSTSGYIVPLFDLKQKGLIESADAEQFFGKGNIFFGVGYVSAIEKVLSGDAEAAAVSYYVLDKDKHLTAEQRAKLKKVVAQGPVPTHVIAVRKTLSADAKANIRAALEDLDPKLRDRVFTSKLVPVDPAKHLAPLEEALDFASGE